MYKVAEYVEKKSKSKLFELMDEQKKLISKLPKSIKIEWKDAFVKGYKSKMSPVKGYKKNVETIKRAIENNTKTITLWRL